MTDRSAIEVPELGLIVLVGASGSGKSTFAQRHFTVTEVVSSDHCRALVGDDETDQSVTGPAFSLLYDIVDRRLEVGRLTVVDATNVKREDRKPLLDLARKWDVLATAIVFDLPIDVCFEHNRRRSDRTTPGHAIRRQHKAVRRATKGLHKERFSRVHVIKTVERLDSVQLERSKLWTDRRPDSGPFDIIGDVHGCADELIELLNQLGYDTDALPIAHPDGRRTLFLGDLVDRGPASDRVLEIAMSMVEAGTALCVLGNHENKLGRALAGRNVTVSHGLAETLEQLDARPQEFRDKVASFIDGLVSHYILDDGRLVVAHAGLPERYQGRSSGRVRSIALYGDTDGETDEFGLPVRFPWAEDYRGPATVVYGHTPIPEPEWLNNTICLDTGAVFGGRLTALRWPEKEIVAIDAVREYYKPIRPLAEERAERPARLLDVHDVLGKWSAKAIELLKSQYAATGSAATTMLSSASALLSQATDRGVDGLDDLLARTQSRLSHAERYVDAYRRYCWDTDGVDGIEIAAFQILAAEGDVLARRPHKWHLDHIDRLVAQDPSLLRPTERRFVDIDSSDAIAEATAWWLESTDSGGEGMVVKPADSITTNKKGLVVPGVKCRGREYLRIIYGPEYLEPANLERLRDRSLGRKTSLAKREFALGIEALDRFVANEHLFRTHQCVFGVLALESEPVDPRL